MAWPSRKEIERVIKKIEKEDLWTLAPPEDMTPLEKFRHDIQQKIVGYKLRTKISQRELAKLMGVDETKVSKILRNRLDEFSTDRLITLYEKLNPKLKLKVA
ncbi:MAG TPA: XRE family transcriptional regulator [Pseudobdellovibrionaceae bacterium]|nr:XRE family transcriptional regulator [Pseudobdellovibrionaceae bacterium]